MTEQILYKEFWIKSRIELNNNYSFNNLWDETIKQFERRIQNYYLKPIEIIKDPNSLNGEGFTILTIQCALIEMLAAFKYGKVYNHQKGNNSPSYEYRLSSDCFIPFLHSELIFENQFYSFENGIKVVDKPFSAKDFYNQVRCGLMHEARTMDLQQKSGQKVKLHFLIA